MLEKFLREAIVTVIGKPSEKIADLLDDKKYINEFLIAKKMDLTINQTRNLLYKLSDDGLVSSIRKKDKRKGWYTYFWKIEVMRCLEFLKGISENKIEQINNQIKNRESRQFYVCDKCNIEFNEENALLYNFTCNECGNVFTIKDNTKVLKEFKKNLDRLKRELSLINEEIRKEKTTTEQKRMKKLKKEEREKKKQKLKIKKKLKKKKVVRKTKKKLRRKIKKKVKKIARKKKPMKKVKKKSKKKR